MRKNVSDVFLKAEFKYVSRISLSLTPLAPGYRAGIFCASKLRCIFTMGAMKNSRFSSPRKLMSCFVAIFVPLRKSLAMNITQISGACSLIRQKWVWSWFYSTTEIDPLPLLWVMQPTWRKVMKAWIYCWERLSMTNLSGSYVLISSCGAVTRNANRVHKILLFPVQVGQPWQEESLCK